MRRSAVIFVLIFTLIIANICTGCGSSAPNQDNGSAKTESGGSSDAAGKTDASGKSGDAGKSDAAGKTGDASSRTQALRILPARAALHLPSARC